MNFLIGKKLRKIYATDGRLRKTAALLRRSDMFVEFGLIFLPLQRSGIGV